MVFLFEKNGTVVSAQIAHTELPINLKFTEHIEELQKSSSIKRTFSENLMVRNLTGWFQDSLVKQTENDKEPA